MISRIGVRSRPGRPSRVGSRGSAGGGGGGGGGPFTYVNTGTIDKNGNVSTCSLAFPAEAAEGQLGIVQVSCNAKPTINASGWTDGNSPTASGQESWIFWKVLTAGDISGGTFTASIPSSFSSMGCISVFDVNEAGTVSVDSGPDDTSGNALSWDGPDITTLTDNCLVWYAANTNENPASTLDISGGSLSFATAFRASSTAAADRGFGGHYAIQPTAGLVEGPTFTMTSGSSGPIQIQVIAFKVA